MDTKGIAARYPRWLLLDPTTIFEAYPSSLSAIVNESLADQLACAKTTGQTLNPICLNVRLSACENKLDTEI